MIVKELIDALEKLNAPDAEIHVAYDSGYGVCGLHCVFVSGQDNPDIHHDYPSTKEARYREVKAGDVILRTDQ